jgi:hypothetical protein
MMKGTSGACVILVVVLLFDFYDCTSSALPASDSTGMRYTQYVMASCGCRAGCQSAQTARLFSVEGSERTRQASMHRLLVEMPLGILVQLVL